jgi:hypothetical protein
VVFAAITRALGVPWHSAVTGAIGTNLRDRPDALPGTAAIAGLPSPHAPGWLLPALGAVLLLGCGLLTGARAGRGELLRPAAWLALVLGVVLPVLTLLAGFSITAAATVFGRTIPVADLGFSGNALVAAPLGVALGAAAGLVGGLAVNGRRRARPVRTAAEATARVAVLAGDERAS